MSIRRFAVVIAVVAAVGACSSVGVGPNAAGSAGRSSAGPGGAASPAGAASPGGAANPAGGGTGSLDGGTIRVYTSVTQATVDAMVAAFATTDPDVHVDVFRAASGELAGRIAAEQREGGVRADVLWLTDPLSMQQYDAQRLLRAWTPGQATAVPARFAGPTFWGTRIIDMVIVSRPGLAPMPAGWHDLADPAYRGAVALPDPGFAGSAFGALGYFALSDGFGLDYYRSLKANGAVQVKSPDDVVTGVAEGRFMAGMTLDWSARSAIAKGSPVALVWPTPGAIAMYSPIAVLDTSANPVAAEAFVDAVLGPAGQQVVAAAGYQPIRADVSGPAPGGPTVSPDWPAIFGRQQELLDAYHSIFGG